MSLNSGVHTPNHLILWIYWHIFHSIVVQSSIKITIEVST